VVPSLKDTAWVGPPQLAAEVGGSLERVLPPDAIAAAVRVQHEREDAANEQDVPAEEHPAGTPQIRTAALPGGERQPGTEACAQGNLAPRQQEARGKGGGEDEGEEPDDGLAYVPAGWQDPCPCKCVCIDLSWIFGIFSTVAGLVFDPRRFFQTDASLFGLPQPWAPTPLVGTPDSWVEQVLLDTRMDTPVTFGLPAGRAPGIEEPLSGVAPLAHDPVPLPARRPAAVLAAGMTSAWEPATSELLPVAVGPGPGIPGIGSEPMYPANGARFMAAPGALPAGFAPAASGFGLGALGERMHGEIRRATP
jgi:hypothetical protein